MANENSSKDEFETLHGPARPYLFEPTAKPGAEWIKLPQRHAKLVLGSFDNVNLNLFFFAYRRYNDKLTISNYLFIDTPHGAYSFGDSIFSLELVFKSKQKYENIERINLI